jgi:hypothetical protein
VTTIEFQTHPLPGELFTSRSAPVSTEDQGFTNPQGYATGFGAPAGAPSGFLAGASDVLINNSNMVDLSQRNYFQKIIQFDAGQHGMPRHHHEIYRET